MKSSSLTFLLLVICWIHAHTQSNTIDYLGQKAPGANAELFAPGLISSTSFEHSAPAFSPDGKMVLWSVMKMPSYRTVLLELNFENGEWSAPHSPSFSDTSINETYPSFSPDGKQLYFSSNKRTSVSDTMAKGNRLWKVEWKGNKWGTPALVDPVVARGGEYASSVTRGGKLYFTYGAFRSPDWNIFLADYVNDKYAVPVKMDFNGPGYEDGPFAAPDESYIIFESQRSESIDGSLDLFICFKNKHGGWEKPKNMGSKINTPSSERFARVSPDGKYLFFGSNKGQTDERGGFDIYWIDAGIIDELRK